MMTARVPVKGVKRFIDRHGKWRCYHRKTGKPIRSEFGTAEFFLELQALDKLITLKEPAPGTLAKAISAYRGSPEFKDRADATKAGYQRYLDVLKPMHGMALVDIDQHLLAQVRDKIATKRGRRTANYALAVLSIVLNFHGSAVGRRRTQSKV